MISKGTAIVIGAGALSGLIYASPTAGNTFSLVFVFFAPLPLFAAGLAFGLTSAIVAIAAGVVLSAVVGGPFDIPFGAPGYVLFEGVPAAVLVRQALLSRHKSLVCSLAFYHSYRLYKSILHSSWLPLSTDSTKSHMCGIPTQHIP